MTVNGKSINMVAELQKPKKEQTSVSPEDVIEFSGPVMSDGFHMQTQKDPVELKKMQGRQRYFFELLATQTFFPSETIEPTTGSLMHQTKFRTNTDAVKIRGNYSLNRGDTLEHKIKGLIPTYERAAFEKLSPSSPTYERDYANLLGRYYGLQIKGLQMLGYMQSENVLSPGAIKINMGIPYFDVSNISKTFGQYIAGVKEQKYATNKEIAPYIEYVEILTLPGDTYGNIFGRIVRNLESDTSHAAKYPNLHKLAGFNDYLKKEFLIRFIGESIKSNPKITTEDFFAGKTKPGTKFILDLGRIDASIAELSRVTYTTDIATKLKQIDQDIIQMVVPVEQNRNLIQSTMFIESYEYHDNDTWYMPNGMRRWSKSVLEEYPSLQNIKHVKSFGDFQTRGIQDLRSGFGTEYITKGQIGQAFTMLIAPKITKYIAEAPPENRQIIQQDLQIVEKAKIILSKDLITKQDLQMLSDYLLKLIRLDDGTGSNVVGKVIGAVLINEKMNSHFQKLNGVLEATREPIRSFDHNPEKMARYEK